MRLLVRLLGIHLVSLIALAGCSKQSGAQVPTAVFKRPPLPSHMRQYEDAPPPTDSTNKSAATTTEWVKVSMPEGPCEILMPGQPERKESFDADGIKSYDYRIEVIKGAFCRYWVTVLQLDDARTTALRNKKVSTAVLLKGMADAMIKEKPDGKLLGNKEIKFEGHSGIEFSLQNTDGFIYQTRAFLINYQLVLVTIVGKKETVESSDAKKFFDSFKISAR